MFDVNDPVYGSYLNDTGLIPRGMKILVEIPEVKEKKGLIHVPESAKKKEQAQAVYAKVLQLGHLCYRDETTGSLLEPWCKPGDLISMSPFTGIQVPLPHDETSQRKIRLIEEESVSGVVVPVSE